MAVFDIKQWVGSLKTEYNIPDDKIPMAEIEGYGLRQDAFSRRQSELNTKEQQLAQQQDTLTKYDEFITFLEKNVVGADRENWSSQTYQQLATQFRGQGGGQGGGDISAAQFQQMVQSTVDPRLTALQSRVENLSTLLENSQRGTAILLDFVPDMREEWRDKYNTQMPFSEARTKFGEFIQAGDDTRGVQPGRGYGMPIEAAWELFKQPYEQKRFQEQVDKQIADAKAEGIQIGRSQQQSLEPYDNGPTMSAADAADRMSRLPAEQQKQVDEAATRSRFAARYNDTIRTGGVGATTTTSTTNNP